MSAARPLRTLSFVALLVTLQTTGARAEEPLPPSPRWTLTTNPARYAVLHFQVELERVLGDRLSVFVAPIGFYHDTWYPFANAPETTARGFGADFGGRYTVWGRAPAGLFVGPYLSLYRGAVYVDGERTLAGQIFSAGAQGGYTVLLGRWVLSAGAGLSYGLASEEAPAGTPKAAQLPHRGSWLNFRLNAGIAF